MVRKIQVSTDGEKDILIWPLTANGDYSVRSAYRMLVDNENQSLPSSSAPISDGSMWKKIWKVRVHHKIRHFLWRATKDSLPTKQNLVAQHIPVGNVCDGYGDHSELVMHALWLCDQVRSVWMTDPGFLFLVQAKFRTFLELLAAHKAVRFAAELCVFRVIIEGDCS
uniref:Reverse transcriptase zinc-binding domain-containing protein n=1 Tax=Quercus lobata TaxID=97700 RepID=A0A7N2LQ94_QUELO